MHARVRIGETIGTHGNVCRHHIFRQGPRRQRRPIALTAAGVPQSRTRLTNLPRERRENYHGVTLDIGVRELVRTTVAEAQIGRTAGSVLFRQRLDDLLIDIAFLRGPGGGVVFLTGLKLLEHRNDFLACDLIGTFKRGRNTGSVIGNSRISRRVPYEIVGGIGGLAGGRIDLGRLSATQQFAGSRIQEERHRSMGAHIVLVVPFVVDDMRDHRQVQRAISSGLERNPLICLRCRSREMRIHDNDLSAGSFCVEEIIGTHE